MYKTVVYFGMCLKVEVTICRAAENIVVYNLESVSHYFTLPLAMQIRLHYN